MDEQKTPQTPKRGAEHDDAVFSVAATKPVPQAPPLRPAPLLLAGEPPFPQAETGAAYPRGRKAAAARPAQGAPLLLAGEPPFPQAKTGTVYPRGGKAAAAHTAQGGPAWANDAPHIPGGTAGTFPAASVPPAAGQQAATARRRPRQGALAMAALVLVVAAALLLTTLLNAEPRAQAAQAKPSISIAQPPEAEGGLTTTEIISMAAASVVSIDLYEGETLSASGSASGVILSADGYVVTNAHVIHGYPLVRVMLSSGEGHTASVVGSDPNSDLAVLKIDATGLQPAEFGDSSLMEPGNRVVAIGNAAGILPGSPSQGIVSGVDRQVSISTTSGDIVLLHLLQTDAAINPGNSGGALVNVYGQIIGISVAKLEDTNVENIGFAIPANQAIPVIQRLINEERDGQAAKLGCVVLALNETTGPAQGLPQYGLYIVELAANSSLREGGAAPGDVIMQADGQAMRATGELLDIIASKMPGDEMELILYRAQTKDTVTIKARLYDAAGGG